MAKYLLFILTLFAFSSCKKNPEEIQIKYSRIGGLCSGICFDELVANKIDINLSRFSGDKKQRIDCSRTITNNEWAQVNNSFNMQAFLRLKEDQRKGKIADLGEIWIEVTSENVTKKVVFDSNNLTPQLVPLISKLEKIRASMECN